jgi:hypothetical protein
MKAIHAIWKNGRIVPTQPVNWPDGTTLTVEPIEDPLAADSQANLMGNDPASIARWIASFDALPPMRMTATEEAEWLAARREMKDHSIAKMRERPIEGEP